MSQEEINRIVCNYFNIESFIEPSKRRQTKYFRERHIAQYLGRIYTRLTLREIGEKTGRDHCIVSYAQKKISFELKEPCFDKNLQRDIRLIKLRIKQHMK